jgi:peptidyl-prolyl cis-trans isomerase B (cyclophilin B)
VVITELKIYNKLVEIGDKICEDVKIEDDNGTVLKENQPVIEKIEMID